jgi:hypothetical protein
MSEGKEKPFFIGFVDAPKELRPFLLTVAALLVVAFAGLALAIGSTQDEPADASFRFDWGPQTVKGVLENDPYPILHVTEGSEHVDAGTTIMLSGVGKNGVQGRSADLEGRLVQATGIMLKRGALDMMQVGGQADRLMAIDGEADAVDSEALGTWRLAGEICDGKCLAGAMRPGRGLSHKACANLCLVGGVPPVFVSSSPLEGSEFLLIGGADGGPMPDVLLDQVATYVEIEGEVERRGSLLVLKADPATLKVLP